MCAGRSIPAAHPPPQRFGLAPLALACQAALLRTELFTRAAKKTEADRATDGRVVSANGERLLAHLGEHLEQDPAWRDRLEGHLGEAVAFAACPSFDRPSNACSTKRACSVGSGIAPASPAARRRAALIWGAFAILLREGLEALLIVVAMIAFLRKAERPEVLRYVHGGWVAALVAGGATWAAATFFISISGASRELTVNLCDATGAVLFTQKLPPPR